MTDFSKGMEKMARELIVFVQSQIDKIKETPLEHNTPRQITNGGKLLAYNKILSKLKAKEENIRKFAPKG